MNDYLQTLGNITYMKYYVNDKIHENLDVTPVSLTGVRVSSFFN